MGSEMCIRDRNRPQMSSSPTPRVIDAGLVSVGKHLQMWRKLNHRSIEQAAAQAGVSVSTLRRLEQGQGATLENFLRVARTYQLLDRILDAVDPLEHDRGRALLAERI